MLYIYLSIFFFFVLFWILYPGKTDIHLHCEEWDQVLDEGNWEPEQIVAKLPTFLKFLRQVQRNVAPHQEAGEDGF